MIKIENVVTPSPEQWEAIIMGTRNPMNSWDRSDSGIGCSVDFVDRICIECDRPTPCVMKQKVILGPNDHDLMMRLAKGGPVHAKYRRMITVYATITAPLYWWKEMDTYQVGVVKNSCSTMHKIAAKEFTLEDFSCEHLDVRAIEVLKNTIDVLNDYRNLYVNYDPNDFEIKGCPSKKLIWWQMIQLLPSSYNQKRTVMLNYEVLTGIYPSRKNHKLDEWHTFCDWIEDLPYSEIITGMTESERTVRIGEKLHEGFKEGLEHLDPAIIDKWNSILERSHCVTFGTADAGIVDIPEENVGPNDGLNKHFGGYEE